MRHTLGMMCWRIVMAWPGAWPSGTVAGWILAWAGDYANEADNANYVLPAPTFKEIGMETAIAVPITAFLNDRVYWGILK
jgi:hypothetical protein